MRVYILRQQLSTKHGIFPTQRVSVACLLCEKNEQANEKKRDVMRELYMTVFFFVDASAAIRPLAKSKNQDNVLYINVSVRISQGRRKKYKREEQKRSKREQQQPPYL